jgi:hypothetical protein
MTEVLWIHTLPTWLEMLIVFLIVNSMFFVAVIFILMGIILDFFNINND